VGGGNRNCGSGEEATGEGVCMQALKGRMQSRGGGGGGGEGQAFMRRAISRRGGAWGGSIRESK
jgi:hypothetical protein